MEAVRESAANDNSESLGIEDLVEVLEKVLDSERSGDSSFEGLEKGALAITNEAVRRVLERNLQKEAESIPNRVVVNDALYQRHEPGTVLYHSLVGPLHVRRSSYRKVGVRNGPTVVPLDLEACLIERATPALAYRTSLGFAKGPLRSCIEDLHASHRLPPSRTTMERIAKRIGNQAKEVVIRIEDHMREEEETIPDEVYAVTLGLDRTTIPMEEDLDTSESPAKNSRRKKRRKPYVRGPRPPVEVNYRMAYVGTVAWVDRDGENAQTRKYAVPAEEGPAAVIHRMMGDLRATLCHKKDIPIGLIQDGAPELWHLMWDALEAEGLRKHCYELIDRYHLSERLADVSKLVETHEGKRCELIAKWEYKLDNYNNAINTIYDELESLSSAVYRGNKKKWKELQSHLTYLIPKDRFRYAQYVKRGLPIGSGITEGACKSVVGARTKRSGQRWRTQGVSSALTLRSLLESQRLPTFWNHFKNVYGESIPIAA